MEMPARMPGPQAPQGIPGMEGRPSPGPIAPTAAAGPSNRAQEFDMARMAAQNQTPAGFKGRLLSGLRAGLAGRGFISGVADPRGEREAEFYQKEAPQIAQRWQLEDADRARKIEEQAQQAAAAKAAQDAALNQARIGEIASQNKSRDAATGLAREQFEYNKNKPIVVAPEGSVYDPKRGPVYQAPPRSREPKQPTQLDFKTTLDQVNQEWGNPRDVATSSTKNRRESIIDTLPDEYKTILRTGKNASGDEAGAEQVRRAQEAFNKAEARDIEQGTKLDTEKREAEARRRLSSGGRPGTGGGPGAPGQGNKLATVGKDALQGFMDEQNQRRKAAGQPLMTEQEALERFRKFGIEVAQ